VVRGKAELEQAVEGNPFVRDGEPKFVHTIFLDRALDRQAFEAFMAEYDGPERLAPGNREFFIDFAEGVARSKLGPAMAKGKRFPFRSTARNVRSLERMIEKMD
jgi:uncharacterized protein (DUF1697 family)